MGELPLAPHPSVVSSLLDATSPLSPDRERIARLVLLDPAICALLLLQTPLQSPGRTLDPAELVRSLPPRILRLLSVSLALSIAEQDPAADPPALLDGFLLHSVSVAHLCAQMATEATLVEPMTGYVAGLLHDLGELLLLRGNSSPYPLLLGLAGSEDELYRLEPSSLGITHADAGAALLSPLGDRGTLPDAVQFHHHPVDQIRHADPLTRLLRGAHELLSSPTPPLNEIARITGLSPERLPTLARAAVNRGCHDLEGIGMTLSGEHAPLPVIPPRRDSLSSLARPPHSLLPLSLSEPLFRTLEEWEDERELVGGVALAARITLGTSRILFLIPDRDDGTLRPVTPPASASGWSHLSIDPASDSVATRALRGECIVRSDDEGTTPTVVDRQICRLLAADGYLAVPVDGGGTTGLFVAPLTLHAPLIFVKNFAQTTAGALFGHLQGRQRRKEERERTLDEVRARAKRIVHEASNPLGAIGSHLKIVSSQGSLDPPLAEDLQMLTQEVERIGRILSRLTTPDTEQQPGERIPVNSVIEGMLSLYADTLFSPSGITVQTDLSPEVGEIGGGRDFFRQILLNLWKNAAEAMPDGGSLTIRTELLTSGKGERLVSLSITDTGPGLPPEVRDHLFHPIERGEDPSQGGVGLSIVDSLVKRMDGTIYCSTRDGRGTCFVLLFRSVT